MRKIERAMLDAIKNRKSWRSGNTEVVYLEEVESPTLARIEHAKVYLHGNHIATWDYSRNRADANPSTLKRWPTATTKSRLRALDVDVYTKNCVTYLYDQAI